MMQKSFLFLIFLLCPGLAACAAAEAQPTTLVLAPAPPAAVASLTAVTDSPPVPVRDLVTLTQQLRGTAVDRVAHSEPLPYAVGDVVPFWFKDLAAGTNEQIDARLVYRSSELNMWVQTGQRVDEKAVQDAARVIEEKIVPTNRAFFGREWTPGVDGDPRHNILHVEALSGLGIAYFSSTDEYVTAVNPYSNEREMLYVSLKDAKIGSDQYYATVAHELQHMSQWHIDKNENAWLNEGLSELAVHLNGFDTLREPVYANRPDIQLTNLSQDPEDVNAHYAAAFLFAAYFNDRFGGAATQSLVQHPENGAAGISAVLAETGAGLTFDDLFADWLVANYLQGLGAGSGVYQYQSLELPPLQQQSIRRLPARAITSVNQYGADYYYVSGNQALTFVFTGTQQVNTIATRAHSGTSFWLSQPADESAAHLTRRFDLSNLEKATLSFWSWYEIEEGWDYGYLSVSTDDGASWTLLPTNYTTLDNPEGNSFGPGLTGTSGSGSPAWVQQTADLTPFTGREILLRFWLITDDAVHLAGIALDDLAIPELGYRHDAEAGSDGWEAAGFLQIADTLPQRFSVKLILLGSGAPEVVALSLDENQQGRWEIPLGETYNEAVVIVAGTTPLTRQTAVYAYEFR